METTQNPTRTDTPTPLNVRLALLAMSHPLVTDEEFHACCDIVTAFAATILGSTGDWDFSRGDAHGWQQNTAGQHYHSRTEMTVYDARHDYCVIVNAGTVTNPNAFGHRVSHYKVAPVSAYCSA